VKNVVIIGAGQAGYACAMRLRHNGFSSRITIVGDEPHFPYQRPPLSKAYLLGETTEEHLWLGPDTALDESRVEFRRGVAVAGLDTARKVLTLSDGESLPFGRLVFATGSRARRLPDAMGMGLDGVFTLRSLEDAARIRAAAERATSAVIIGGGFIGLEVAASLSKGGRTVTVVEGAPRILARVAGETISREITQRHLAQGVQIITSAQIERLAWENGRFGAVELADGRRLAADMAIVGIGGVANDDIASAAGLETRNGIVVDATGRTGHPDIFAAGDCALFPINGTFMRLESVQNAHEQGMHVADVICGTDAPYAPVPWFWSDQHDFTLQTAGLSAGHDAEIALPGSREGGLAVWYLRQGTAIAVDTINESRTYMAARRVFGAGRTLTAAEIGAPGFDIMQVMRGLNAKPAA
jgi:3-phenylpropionate/trans-cinnamate dioxygenase ferredoxin reductase component